jgi:hypothetical protein
VVPASDGQKREGDCYVVQFVAPDGQQAKIPLSVYRSLPKEAFKDDEGTLDLKSNAPQEVVRDEHVSEHCA